MRSPLSADLALDVADSAIASRAVVREPELHVLVRRTGRSYWRVIALRGCVSDLHERRLVQFVQRADDRQTADELRDQTVANQIFGLDHLERLAPTSRSRAVLISAPNPSILRSGTPLVWSSPTNAPPQMNSTLLDVDLEELLVRMLATALGRHVGDGAFENF